MAEVPHVVSPRADWTEIRVMRYPAARSAQPLRGGRGPGATRPGPGTGAQHVDIRGPGLRPPAAPRRPLRSFRRLPPRAGHGRHHGGRRGGGLPRRRASPPATPSRTPSAWRIRRRGTGGPALGGLGTLTRLDVHEAEPQRHLGPLGGYGPDGLRRAARRRRATRRETVWVSAAAGAVGSFAVRSPGSSATGWSPARGPTTRSTWLRDRSAPTPSTTAPATWPPGGAGWRPRESTSTLIVGGGPPRGPPLSHLTGAAVPPSVARSRRPSPARPGPRNLFLAVSKDLTLRGFRGSSNLHLMGKGGVLYCRLASQRRWAPLSRDRFVGLGVGLSYVPTEMIAGHTAGKTFVSLG